MSETTAESSEKPQVIIEIKDMEVEVKKVFKP